MLKGTLTESVEEGIVVREAVMMPSYMKNDEQKAVFATAKVNDVLVFNPNAAYNGSEVELASLLKIQKEEVSLQEKMEYLENYATSHKHFSFRNLLESQSSKVEIIVTFLAILELMKVGKIFISQENLFDDIKIESKIVA